MRSKLCCLLKVFVLPSFSCIFLPQGGGGYSSVGGGIILKAIQILIQPAAPETWLSCHSWQYRDAKLQPGMSTT